MDMWEKLHPKSHGQMGGDVQRGLDTLGGIFNQLSRAQQQQLLNMGFSFGGSIPGLGSAGVSHKGFSVNTNYGGFGGSWGQQQQLQDLGFSFGGSVPGLGSAGISHKGFGVNTNYGNFGGSWGQQMLI